VIYGAIVAAVAIVALAVVVVVTMYGQERAHIAASAREADVRAWVLETLEFERESRGDLVRAIVVGREPIAFAAADRSINRARLAADQENPAVAEALVEAERDTARLMERMRPGRRDAGMGEPRSQYVDPESGEPIIPVGAE
jgi:hypothetical protein